MTNTLLSASNAWAFQIEEPLFRGGAMIGARKEFINGFSNGFGKIQNGRIRRSDDGRLYERGVRPADVAVGAALSGTGRRAAPQDRKMIKWPRL